MTFGEREKDDNRDKVKLNWKDYVAFVIALLQTTLLPIVIIIVIIMLLVLVLLIGRNVLLFCIF